MYIIYIGSLYRSQSLAGSHLENTTYYIIPYVYCYLLLNYTQPYTFVSLIYLYIYIYIMKIEKLTFKELGS